MWWKCNLIYKNINPFFILAIGSLTSSVLYKRVFILNFGHFSHFKFLAPLWQGYYCIEEYFAIKSIITIFKTRNRRHAG
jgi:hypothetical protein